MKRYIYPSGVTGRFLGYVMQYVDEDIEIEYIDDKEMETSLEKNVSKIQDQHQKIWLGFSTIWGWETLSKAEARLQKYEIQYERDAISIYLEKMIDKIKSGFIKKDKVVVIVVELIAGGKHIGKLHNELIKRGVKVILCCTHLDIYEKCKFYSSEKCLVLYWLGCYCDRIKFGTVLCATSDLNFRHKFGIFLGHAMYNKADYKVILGLKKSFRAFCIDNGQHLLSNRLFSSVEYIPSGYLGFDVFDDCNVDADLKNRDSVLVAPYDLSEFFKMLPLIYDILGKYRVILRYRREFIGEANFDEFRNNLRDLREYANFAVDNGSMIAKESYRRAFCLLCAQTTAKYSFPILNLVPSVVLPHNNVYLGLCVNDDLGINMTYERAKTELLDQLDSIYSNLEKWREKIKHYRDKNVFNFGKASEWLADYLIHRHGLLDD